MKTNVEKLEGDRVRLTTTLSPEEVDKAIDDAYAHTANTVRIKGFRKGKAPREVINLQVGEINVLADARRDAISDYFPLALDAEDLQPIAPPVPHELGPMKSGEEFSFEVELEMRPELKLAAFDDIKVTVPPAEISDGVVDVYVEDMRDRYAKLELVDGGLAPDGFASISFIGRIDGEFSEDSTVYEHLHQMGIGTMPEEFESAIAGSKAGDELHVEFPIPDTAADPTLVGKTVSFEVTIHEVLKSVLPEVNDEFASEIGGFDSVEEMRDDIRQRLTEKGKGERKGLIEEQAHKALLERLEGEIPKSMFDARGDEVVREFAAKLAANNLDFNEYLDQSGLSRERVLADLKAEAERRVREEFALDALAREVGIKLSEGEIDAEVAEVAEEQNITLEAAREMLRTRGTMPLLRQDLLRRAAMRWLTDHVEVVEEEPAAAVAAALKPKKAQRKPEGKGSEKAADEASSKAGNKATEKPAKKASAKAASKEE